MVKDNPMAGHTDSGLAKGLVGKATVDVYPQVNPRCDVVRNGHLVGFGNSVGADDLVTDVSV